ncbi:MAG: NfeD family protein [Pseudomonadota bacterium]
MGDGELMTISYIYWIAAGLLLGAAEMVVPGFILMWFGVAALAVGLLTLALPTLGWPLQLAIFAAITAVFLVFWWNYQRKRPKTATESEFNRRADGMVGKTFTLSDGLKHGSGHSFIGDTRWQIRGQDAPIGTQVRVVGVTDESILNVEFVAGPDAKTETVGPIPRKDALATSSDSDRQVTDPTAP